MYAAHVQRAWNFKLLLAVAAGAPEPRIESCAREADETDGGGFAGGDTPEGEGNREDASRCDSRPWGMPIGSIVTASPGR